MVSEESNYKSTLKAVEDGDHDAKTELAWYLLSGYGGAEVRPLKAVDLLEDNVKEDDAEAMWMLGLCYEYGLGLEQDMERAKSLYQQSSWKENEIGKYLAGIGEDRRGSGILREIGLLNLCKQHVSLIVVL